MSVFSNQSLLELYTIPGIGPARMRMLIRHFGSPESVLKAPVSALKRVKGLDLQTIDRFTGHRDLTFVNRQLHLLEKHDVRLISYWDAPYPTRLKRIYDAPVLLYFKGRQEILESPGLAVVGTREPTYYGKQMTERFVKELCEKGMTIISGLARGVDTIAHRTVLNMNGGTIAVLGGGIDWIYPRENGALAEAITENGGLLSEYPMGIKPEAMNFPKRNRIISGLSLGVLITEAGMKSGALITAFNALEQNREVFAIPGPITSEYSRGTNQIIKEGAKLVQHIDDITEELTGQISLFNQTAEKKQVFEPELGTREKAVYLTLKEGAVYIDKIAETAGMNTAEALTILLNLELDGLVRQLPGKMFSKAMHS